MKHALTRRIALSLAVLAAMAVGLPASALAERFELRGSKVAIYNLAGEVEIVAGTGNAVVVELTRGGADGDDLEIATGEIDGKQTLRVLYNSRRVHYDRGSHWGSHSNSTIRVGRDGRFSDGSTRRGEGQKVRVSTSGGGMDAYADMRITVPKGQNVALYLAVGEAGATGVDGDLRIDVSAASVRTESTAGKLSIDVGSGGVDVMGHDGPISVDTGSGEVEISDVKGAHVGVDTGSGSVTGTNVQAERFSVDTGSGSVRISGVSADEISIDTGSGRVNLELTRDVDLLSVDTGSGSVTVTVPADLGAEVYIETGSGGIRSDVPMQIQRKDRDSVRGTIGNGKGRIVIETGSGGVRLLKG